MVEFRLLGDLEIRDRGETIPLNSGKQRVLLAALLLNANRVVPIDLLVDALWGDGASPKAAGNLHALVSRLRGKLGSQRLERHSNGYLLRLGPDELDLNVFERLRERATCAFEEDRAEEASADLRRALDLWRGPPLADFTYEPWAAAEIRRLEELKLVALEDCIEAELGAGRHALLVAELQRLVTEHPLRETFRRQLMLALYRSGRQAEALEAYRDARTTLDEELGLEPSPQLRELEQAILLQDPLLELPASMPKAQPAPAAVVGKSRVRKRSLVLAAAASLILSAMAAAVVLHVGGKNQAEATASGTPVGTGEPAAGPWPRTRIGGVHTASTKRSRASGVTRPRSAENRLIDIPVSSTATRNVTASRAGSQQRAQASKPKSNPKPKPKPEVNPPPPPARDPVVITDNFDDGVIDGNVWHQVVDGTGLSIAEQNGRLEMTIDAGAAGNEDGLMEAHYGSQCRVLGDFDVRVDYALLDWPLTAGVVVQLAAWFQGNGMSIGRESVTGEDGEGYTSTAPPGWTQRRAGNDTSGSLRIKRVGEMLTTYYRAGDRWRHLYSFFRSLGASGGIGPAVIAVQVFSLDEMFGDRTVRVGFDNVFITAEETVCG